ncbi:MAG TPA: pentapeptide repeat-containing protein [Longimicrobiaceae bacterium]|nr:pentapeptide repeat-containing protein [Longimicrobiaceae bacterium]
MPPPPSPQRPFMGKFKLAVKARDNLTGAWPAPKYQEGWILPPREKEDFLRFSFRSEDRRAAATITFYGTLASFVMALEGKPITMVRLPARDSPWVVVLRDEFGLFTAEPGYYGGLPDDSRAFFFPVISRSYPAMVMGGLSDPALRDALGDPGRYLDFNLTLKPVTRGAAEIAAVGGAPGADLAHVDLSGVRWEGVDLTGANLTGARLAGAKLARAKLDDASLVGADLSGADLTGATVAGLDLRTAELGGTRLCEMDLTGALLDPQPRISRNAQNPTRFEGSTLPYSILGPDWTSLVLARATLVGLPQDLTGLAASGADLSALNLNGRRLRRAKLDRAVLRGTNLSLADLTGASMDGAVLEGDPARGYRAAALTGAEMVNVVLTNAQMSGVDLSYTYFYGTQATVSGATMNLVNFAGAYLTGLNFSNVRDRQLRGATFSGACLVNCSFRGTDLSEYDGRSASFSRACLQGADFSNATLFGAVMVDAAVALEPGKLEVTIKVGGKTLHKKDTYDTPTRLPPAATSSDTKCPSGDRGPCAGRTLSSPNAPTEWPERPPAPPPEKPSGHA